MFLTQGQSMTIKKFVEEKFDEIQKDHKIITTTLDTQTHLVSQGLDHRRNHAPLSMIFSGCKIPPTSLDDISRRVGAKRIRFYRKEFCYAR